MGDLFYAVSSMPVNPESWMKVVMAIGLVVIFLVDFWLWKESNDR